MMIKGLRFLVPLLMLLALGQIASGQCEPDSNDSSASAVPIGLNATVSGYICPDDPIDYFVLTIPGGSDVSGSISFESTQTGTTFRIDGKTAGRIFDDDTTGSEHSLTLTFESGDLSDTIYYIRVSFWSAYAYDHDYTIVTDISGDLPDCLPDNNDDPGNAEEISFGETVRDWVCNVDHIDIWHFTVTTDTEGSGTVTLTADPGEVFLYVYDWFSAEIYHGRTTDGSMQYELGTSESPLEAGEYYLGVFLPLARNDENFYTLELSEGIETFTLPEVGPEIEQRVPEPVEAPLTNIPVAMQPGPSAQCPWPSTRGNSHNTARSYIKGPGASDEFNYVTHNFELTRSDIREKHRYYNGLLVGKDGWVYCLEHPSKELLAFRMPDNDIKWSIQTGSVKPACLDGEGNIYYIHKDGNQLVKANPHNGTSQWVQDIPEPGDKSVENIGGMIYTATVNTEEASSYVRAWNKEGTWVRASGPLDGEIVGVAEDDSRRLVYIQTGKSLYQVNYDGTVTWTNAFPIYQGRPPGPVGGLDPIIDSDGNVWAYDEGTRKFYVYASDGASVSSGEYTERPQAACLGADGCLYLAFGDKISCYKPWDTVLWEKTEDFNEPTYGTKHWVAALIMDSRGILYDCTYREWYKADGSDSDLSCFYEILDPDYVDDIAISARHQVGERDWGLDSELIDFILDEAPITGGVELGLGEDGSLVILHYIGRLQVRIPE